MDGGMEIMDLKRNITMDTEVTLIGGDTMATTMTHTGIDDIKITPTN